MTKETAQHLISQAEINELLNLQRFIADGEKSEEISLVDEINNAILDSGKLTLEEWKSLRQRIHEIELLIPHIDLIIQLKEKKERRKKFLRRA